MSKIKAPLVAAIGALVLVGILFLSFILSSSAYRDRESKIVLPSEQEMTPVEVESKDNPNKDYLVQIEITPDNVQKVIEALIRPGGYTMTVKNTLHVASRSRVISCRQSVKNDAVRIDYLNDTGNIERTELMYGKKCYAWKNGSKNVYEGAAGSFSGDTESMLPTYQTVCELPREQITTAKLATIDGDPCIQVETADGDRQAEYIISAATGLLKKAVYQQKGVTFRSVETETELTSPEDALFALPGTDESILDSAAA